jgi:hypothetical protein
LIIQDVRGASGGIAKVSGNIMFGDGGDCVVVEEEPCAEGFDEGDVVPVVWAAVSGVGQ